MNAQDVGQRNGSSNPGHVDDHTNLKWNHDNAEHWQECVECGKVNQDSKEKHTFKDGVCTNENCKYKCQHTNARWEYDANNHWKRCPDCDVTEVPNTRGTHNFDTSGRCTDCGYKKQSSGTGHTGDHTNVRWQHDSRDHWQICDDCGGIEVPGSRERHTYKNGVCTNVNCNYACPHTNARWEYDANNHWKRCPDCDVTEVPNTRGTHSFDSSGRCECGYVKSSSTTCNHPNIETKSDANEHWTRCTVCGEELSRGTHTFTQLINTKPATCKEAGSTTYKCTGCTETNTVTTPALGHQWGDWEDNGNGTHSRECERPNCDEKETKSHNYGDDDKCDDCGADKNGNSGNDCTHPNAEWKHNHKEHWKECPDCKEEVPNTREPHEFDENGHCPDCGYDCTHPNLKWEHDDDEHWQECPDCGKEIPGTREKHSYKDGKCEDCGIKDSDSSDNNLPFTGTEIPAILYLILIIVVIVGAVGLKKYKDI